MTAVPHLQLVPEVHEPEPAPVPPVAAVVADQGPARPVTDIDGRPLDTPHTEILGPDWAAARGLAAAWGVLLGTSTVGAVSGGPEAAVMCGLAGLAVLYVAGQATSRA